MGWTVYHERIDQAAVPGKALGRHVRHDSRSLAYRYQRLRPVGIPTSDVLLPRHIPILDQGDVGSCVGNAETGDLGTGEMYEALLAAFGASVPPLDEAFALGLYSAAETIDGDGPYPPNDNGSTGLSVAQAAKNAGWISGYVHCLSVPDVLDAIAAGHPVILGTNWYDCLPDGQRVLTADLRWVPIEKVQVGDELIGFDECIGHAAKYRRSRVLALGTKPAPVYEVVTDQGTVYASAQHLFVRSAFQIPTGYSKGRQQWVTAENLQPGDKLAYFMAPYGEDTSWEAGWLAGFFDGEGTIGARNGNQLNFGQALGPTLDMGVRLLAGKGYQISVKQYREVGRDNRGIIARKPLANVYIRGGYQGALRFLGEMRPSRLLPLAWQLWDGKAIRSKGCPCAVVQEVRSVGTEMVHTIGTSTQTLIVEGFLSHNSMDSPDPSGLVAISPDAVVRGGHEYLARGLGADARLVNLDNSWGTSWGVRGSFTYSWDTLERLLAEQGDGTVSVPLSQPAPVPVPPVPVPPQPPVPDANPDDVALAPALRAWLTAKGL